VHYISSLQSLDVQRELRRNQHTTSERSEAGRVSPNVKTCNT
jgi:hypothetical protein